MTTRPARRSPRPGAARPTAHEEVVLDVGAPAHGGHCVARTTDDPSGRVIFVRHALPGERVRAVLTQKTAKIWRADAVEVISASPDRVEPAWPQAGAGGVGGGELSHVALAAQRTWKRWVLADCLRRIGGEDVARAVTEAAGGTAVSVEPLPSEARAEASPDARTRALAGTGTRTRLALTADERGRFGMHAFRSSTVLDPGRLPLAVAAIRDLGLTERALWRRHARPGSRLEAVAPSAGEPLVLIDGQVLTAEGRATSRRRVDEVVDASGLGMGELRYSVHADGFWQVHEDAPAALVDAVVRAVVTGSPSGGGSSPAAGRAAGTSVLELYSGAGLLTLPLAVAGARVVSLEGSAQAVGDARRTLHGHDAVSLRTGRVSARAVDELGRLDSAAPDVVVLDPPRQGAGREVIDAIAALGPRRVVLVACDPAALARDLGSLLRSGYTVGGVRALDMFPHTHHFETVAVLDRS
ncbi:TRAM domain-containing protein [Actinomyces sp. AC-20-1]|uniref:class I SAM-dependent RNA methyltransferase n=5 Tax=Actinomyces TaxID=1654 RepID=UPI002018FCBA|nr:TRAM domain-containing protein [Actinomyces sp. AC-20-1]MCL3777548.1 class I SAM-dependent RNA methyltransferase [Actinomyces sp. AC-20-1]